MSPRKDPIEEKRSRLSEARESPGSPASLAILRKGLSDCVSIVVAKAAEIGAELETAAIAPDLVEAFHRFLAEPLEDKGCLAKNAIAEALIRIEHPDPDVFLAAARHVQREPVWGGTEDTAAWLRGLGAIGLAGCGHPRALAHLVEVLADPEKLARIGAARALGALGGREPSLLLRLKLLLGDRETEVLSECFRSLLAIEPGAEGTPFVARFLDADHEATAEAAALALGESRQPQAFDLLKRSWEEVRGRSLRQAHLVAISLLRTPTSTDFLVSLLERPETARGALSALGPFLYSDELRERVRRAVERDDALRELYESELRRNRIPPE